MQPASPAQPGAPLYEAFYDLREQPFALSTDPRFLYMSASHRRAHDTLLTGLRRREGVLLLTGDTGTGKTTLCRAVVDALGARTFSALIHTPYMSVQEVLRVILRDFGLVSRDEIRRGAFDRADLPHMLDTLESFLRSLILLDSHAVVIIDEAQSLSPEVLNQVRMLGAYEQDGQRLLQIVLCGQPPLLETLQAEPMRALNERITRRAALAALSAEETGFYISHRLAVAGRPDAVMFAPDAVALIAQLSSGLPLRINLLCDRALEEGRAAGTTVISEEIVRRAAKSVAGTMPDLPAKKTEPSSGLSAGILDLPSEFVAAVSTPRARRGWILAAAGVLVVVIAGGGLAAYLAWSIGSSPAEIAPAPPVPPAILGELARPVPPPPETEIKKWLEAPVVGGLSHFPDSGDERRR